MKNKGLTNALVIDNNDISINYKHSNTDNASRLPLINLFELVDIFKKDPDNILSYDSSECITFILNNGEEIPIHKYNPEDGECTIKFLKITTPELKQTDNEILIYANYHHFILSGANALPWGDNDFRCLPKEDLIDMHGENITSSKYFYNGFDATNKIYMRMIRNKSLSKTFKYVHSMSLKINSTKFQAYLPAIGQLNVIFNSLQLINYLLDIYCKSFKILSSAGFWWSSSEISESQAAVEVPLAITDDIEKLYLMGYEKTYTGCVFPLFKKVN